MITPTIGSGKMSASNDCHIDKRINNKTEWNLVLFPTVRVDNGDTD